MSGCRCDYGGIAAARRFLTAVQRFSAIVSMSRAFERRLEVGASCQRLRRTSVEFRYLFLGSLCYQLPAARLCAKLCMILVYLGADIAIRTGCRGVLLALGVLPVSGLVVPCSVIRVNCF